MALERQSIEKKDFPIGRRGYDPEAVDAHLQSLAGEVEELKRTSRRRTGTLASSASEQVQAIVEAAETSAAEIQRQADEEAQEIRGEASSEAQATREQAVAQAREYVGKVSESTATMLQRLDAMESELSALVEALRTGANRVNADLQLLEGNLSEVSTSVGQRSQFEVEDASGAASQVPSAVEPDEASDPGRSSSADADAAEHGHELDASDEDPEGAHLAHHGEHGEESRGRSGTAGEAEEDEGARLIALNMALNGTPREETERYLAENFQLRDAHGLLDEVYASVEG